MHALLGRAIYRWAYLSGSLKMSALGRRAFCMHIGILRHPMAEVHVRRENAPCERVVGRARAASSAGNFGFSWHEVPGDTGE